MLRLSPRARWTALRTAVLAGAFACGSSDPTGTNTAVNGTISANLSQYGPWTGQTTVTATAMNGSLTIVGQDINFKKITLFLVGVNVSAGQEDTPRTFTLTPVTADTVGYAELYETFQTGVVRYNTFVGGHATVVLTHVGADHVTGTFEFIVQEWPGGTALRSASGGVFDIRPTIGS